MARLKPRLASPLYRVVHTLYRVVHTVWFRPCGSDRVVHTVWFTRLSGEMPRQAAATLFVSEWTNMLKWNPERSCLCSSCSTVSNRASYQAPFTSVVIKSTLILVVEWQYVHGCKACWCVTMYTIYSEMSSAAMPLRPRARPHASAVSTSRQVHGLFPNVGRTAF